MILNMKNTSAKSLKECHVKLSSFMEFIKHIAKNHVKEQSEDEEIKGQKEKQDDEDEKVSHLDLTESWLDEFLIKKN